MLLQLEPDIISTYYKNKSIRALSFFCPLSNGGEHIGKFLYNYSNSWEAPQIKDVRTVTTRMKHKVRNPRYCDNHRGYSSECSGTHCTTTSVSIRFIS